MKTKLKILHLEDTPSDAELVERELKKANIQFETLVVGNKTAFEKALKEFAPDIIISDHTLPSFDSKEAIKIIKRQGIKIPFILVSATVSDEYAVEIMKAGADDYILKDRLHRLPQAVLNALEKNRAEQHLYESEAFNKDILSSLNTHIAVIDKNGKLIAVNMAWDDFAKANGADSLQGVSKGSNYFEVCQRSMALGDIIAGQTLQGIRSVFNKEVKTFELEYPCHSLTEQRWFNLSVTNFGEDDSKVVISHQNITQRKIAEQKLQKSESRLKEAQIVAKVGSWETNLQTLSVIWSEEHHHIFETDPKTFHVTQEAFYDFIHPEDRDIVKTTFENSFDSQTLNSIEHRIIATNGGLKHVCERWIIFRDAQGHPVRAVGTSQDITTRKLAEEEITKLSLVARKTSNAVVMTDAEEKILWVNDAFTRMTGFELNEIMGKRPGTFLQGPETNPVVVRYMRRKIRNRQAFQSDIINYTKSGHKYWTRIQCQPEFDSTGKLTGFFSIQTDITKDKKAEKAIYKLTERLTLATTSAKIGIWDWDVVNYRIIWDKMMYQIFGVAEDKFSGAYEAWEATVHPEDIDEENAKVQSALRGDSKFDSEFRIVWPDTSIRYIKGDAIVVRDDTGKPIRMIGTNLDITERKKSDEENRFKANLLNTIGQSAIATDTNGIVNYWNKAAENIYGWTKEEALGKHIINLTASESTKEQANQIMEELKKGQSWSGEFKMRKKDGTNFPALVTNSPIHDENNVLSGIIGISSDITEIKKLEELLEKTNRLAAVGSWEIDVVKGTVFWSDITKEIREVDKDYAPILGEGMSYFKGTHKEIISQKVQECTEHGTPWDEELQIITYKGNYKWIRTIGEGEFVNGKCIRIHGSFQDIDERKKAEEAIRAGEEKRKLIMSGALDAIISIDTNNIITFWNPQAEVIFGWKEAEVMGQPLSELIVPIPLRKYHTEGMKHYLKTGEGKAINALLELRALRKSGEEFPIELTVIPIKQGEEVFFCAFIRDITQRKDSEIKLSGALVELEAERIRLVTAQAMAKVGSWETDLQTFQVNWSNETHRIFGSNPDKFKASHSAFLDFIHPEDREKVDAAFKDSLNKSGSNSVEHRIITLQGKEKWVEENWTVTTDEKGSPMVAIGTCQDITESKKAADKIIRNEAKLNIAQYISQVGSYEVDMVTNEQSWSDEFYRILGIKAYVTPSREAFLSCIHTDDRAMAFSTMEDALSNYEDSSFQFRFIRKNGQTGYASSEWNFEFDSNGHPLYIHGILRDLTKEKKAESERVKMISDIVQRNSDLEQFSYIVSHNLRAPTANIIGFAEILQDESLTPVEQKELLRGLSTSVTGLDTVIKDINTILQINREFHEEKEIVIFSKLVSDIMISIGNLIDKHRVRILTDFSEVDEIYSLKVYIYSIFYNLISNSIKYSKPNEQPLIEIKSIKEKGKIILIFKDNGLGMDMTTKGDKIFGLYNRFHSHVEGKGMGLFMVKTQVESLGGKITIASELNKGTEFTIEVAI